MSLQVQGGEYGLLRLALLVVFWRRSVHQWLLDSGVRSGSKLFFLSVLKAEAGLGEEAAVGEDSEDVEHPGRYFIYFSFSAKLKRTRSKSLT